MIVNVYTYKGAARRERYKHKTARNGAQTKVGAGSAEKGAHIGQYKHNKKGTNLQAGSGEKGTSSKYLAGNGAQTKVQEKNRREKASSAMVQAPMYKQEPVGEDFTIS